MKKIISILLAAVMVMALLAGCGSKNSDKTNDNNTPNNNQTTELSGSVSTNGSTSMDKVIGALREQFMADHKNVTVTYDPTGSGSGIEAVKNGTADIGLASRSLKDEEKADGLTETVIALDGIAVIVNAQSKVTDLTVEQIAKIFTGEITDWSEVGGDPGAISCIGRESGSGTRDGFESITGTKDSCKLDQELTSTGGGIEAVAGNPNAIGYASLSAVEGKDTIKALTVGGVACTEETVLDGCYKIENGDVTKLESFENGLFHVQDIASQLCCHALSPDEGDTVLDVCAAPGGKTFTMAELMNNGGKIFAFDIHEHRVKLIRNGAKRLGITNISAETGNAAVYNEKMPMADKILCDVPCSGLGVIRRKPEIKYKNYEEFERLPEIQYRILETAASYLKKGGELVYSTCTVNPAENGQVIDRFLNEHRNFEGITFLEELGKPFGEYKVTLFPENFNSDGFFISKIKRTE